MDTVKILTTYSADIFQPLLDLVSKRCIPKKTSTNNRRGFTEGHRAITFGITTKRCSTVTGLSYYSKKMPEIYKEILKLGEIVCPFPFKSIHLNHNVVCPKHLDSNNVGESLLISFGDYQGCNIVIEDTIYDAKHTPIIFNGSKLTHWNTDDLQGNKYSLVYYN